ncbi:asparagine synthase-related protein [Natrononativus amylolyticus]|uniref:asparagine synthase-related protein n=1 Tax=Natrononativus amylolyticus TaxID=2963434 RepID=UPI0020CCF8AA|nr:asparagine synthase-related protein [Natrononativus amylolyticus]
MNKELFGVFGDRDDFYRHRSRRQFDEVLEGPTLTVGIRDPGLGIPSRSSVADRDDGCCVVWGEAFPPNSAGANTAAWLLDTFKEYGTDALSVLNGSYVAVVDTDDETIVATDPIRSWECFYTDDCGVRTFGTDAAAVARTTDRHDVHRDSLREFMHIGTVFGEKTLLEQLHRVPFDGFLTASEVGTLERFVYNPQEFDYVDELAARLRRAIARRSRNPGREGLLLSAGYDSRLLLSQVPSIEHCYTIGSAGDPETVGAEKLAAQYGAEHTVFEPDERYLMAGPEKTMYSQGIKESLHIHHAGYTGGIDVDTMYHGLLCDTLIRGHFVERKHVDMFGKRLPLPQLEPDPDPVQVLVDRFGYVLEKSETVARCTNVDGDPHSFVLDAIGSELVTYYDRAENVHNRLDCCGIANQPTLPFRVHLADNYLESMLITDVELLDWHLTTPPEHRNTRTFLKAIEQLDPDILRHSPPDRPHKSQVLNAIRGYVCKKTPFVRSPQGAWPDRIEVFNQYNLDQRLFPDRAYLHELPPRHKLRANDALGWLDHCVSTDLRTEELLAPNYSSVALD